MGTLVFPFDGKVNAVAPFMGVHKKMGRFRPVKCIIWNNSLV